MSKHNAPGPKMMNATIVRHLAMLKINAEHCPSASNVATLTTSENPLRRGHLYANVQIVANY